MPDPQEGGDVAVLVSGGVDSAILSVDLTSRFARVFPAYVRSGLRWEEIELGCLRAFLAAVARPALMPLRVFDEPVADVYGTHWSTGAPGVPDADAPDEAVYLPGRNLLLVAKVAVWCRLRQIPALALGCLASNPFPDSTPEFYGEFESVLERALAARIRLLRPFEGLHKADVLRRGVDLPLWLTFSCLRPVGGLHCGRCNKCAERRRGFHDLGQDDRTAYAENPPSTRPAIPGERPKVRCIE
jgi:7-cyano-7-deazaguanine synthase